MEKYPIEVKSVKELIEEADAILRKYRDSGKAEMTIEEEMEADAEYGYFEDD